MRNLLFIILSFQIAVCVAQEKRVYTEFKHLDDFDIELFTHHTKLLGLQFIDTLTGNLQPCIWEKQYTCNQWFMNDEDIKKSLHKLDKTLLRIDSIKRILLFETLASWHYIYKSLQIENMDNKLHHLPILLLYTSEKYIPHNKNIHLYRKLAQNIGLEKCLDSLQKDNGARFDILMQMTNHICGLSPKERLIFFDLYIKDAKKLLKLSLKYPPSPKDNTKHRLFKYLTKHQVYDMHQTDILTSLYNLDTTNINFQLYGGRGFSIGYHSMGPALFDNEKQEITINLDNFLAKMPSPKATKIISTLYKWYYIHEFLKVEFLNKNLDHLVLILGYVPEFYIMKPDPTLEDNRKEAKKEGVESYVYNLQGYAHDASLDDVTTDNNLIIVQMTTQIYLYSLSRKLDFFEMYFQEAIKLIDKKK